MNMNLARKWRSKHFDEVVGQSLVVRLVKNSLYRNLVFPVYLLSGTRGSGKTSVARIFAAALNCKELETFQKNPQAQQLPCLNCDSCKAMQTMNHPDFIEMDAASHTGVDNVRQIIEAASFIPVLGTKKIYLIDEAHMLSKAAFNALLKMLEEPPPSVVFMLATTDPHKILDTVTSRCFHLFFEPINSDEMVRHLSAVCQHEGLTCDEDALKLVAQESGGSLRDALNLIERLRIAYEHIKRESVIELLASIDNERLIELLEVLTSQSVDDVLKVCAHLELKKFNAQIIWKKLVELLRSLVWVKHGVSSAAVVSPERLKKLAQSLSIEKIIALMELCYSYELSFLKTADPSSMLEMLLLKMHMSLQTEDTQKKKPQTVKAVEPIRSAPAPVQTPVQIAPQADLPAHWAECLVEIQTLNDPLLVSIFKQGNDVVFEDAVLKIKFSQDLLFFKDWLENTKALWQPLLKKYYGDGVELAADFTAASTKERPIKLPPVQPMQKAPVKAVQPQQKSVTQMGKTFSPDAESWQKAHLLNQLFPGTLVMHEKENA